MHKFWNCTYGGGNPLLLLGFVAAVIIAAQNYDQFGGFGKPRVISGSSLAAAGCGGSAVRAITCGKSSRRASSIVFLSSN